MFKRIPQEIQAVRFAEYAKFLHLHTSGFGKILATGCDEQSDRRMPKACQYIIELCHVFEVIQNEQTRSVCLPGLDGGRYQFPLIGLGITHLNTAERDLSIDC